MNDENDNCPFNADAQLIDTDGDGKGKLIIVNSLHNSNPGSL